MYDADGRLLAVVERGGDAYVYRYDPAGNILSITHRQAGLSVLRVSPAQGRPGQVVHLFGTGFSGRAANDHVTIGGKATATPKVVSPVELDVVVPAGSAGGKVTVRVGPASASAAAPLGQAPGPPVIAAVTASTPLRPHTLVIAPGAELVINGKGFDTTPDNDRVMIGQEFASVVSVTPTRLTVAAPPGPAFSGRLVVTTPTGSVTGPDVFSVPNDMIGTASAYPLAARVSPGRATKVTFSGAQQTALLLVDGQAGQRLSVAVGAGTLATGTVQLFAPGGDDIVEDTPESAALSFPFGQTARVLFATTLRRNGTYLLSVTSDSGGGTAPVTVSVFGETTQSIKPNGAAVTATVSAAGRRVVLPFTVTAPEQVSVQYSASTFPDNSSPGDFLYLTDRTGNAFGPAGTYSAALEPGRSGYIVTTKTLIPGPYSIVVDPSQTGDTGSVSLRLRTFTDLTGPIAANGPAVTASITTPGQRAIYTFAGTAGERVSAAFSGSTLTDDELELIGPDGSIIRQTGLFGASGFLEPVILPSAGTYQLVVDTGTSGDTGTARLRVYSFADQTATITPNAPAVTATVKVPGQRVLYSFAGTAGQRVSAAFSANTFADAELELTGPDGSFLTQKGLFTTSGFLPSITLPSTGTYQLIVDPSTFGQTGKATIRLYSFADQTATITPNGPAVTATITVPGQRALYSFSVSSAVNVTASWTGSTFTSDRLELVGPDGSSIDGTGLFGPSGSLGPDTLTTAGTYQVIVDPSQDGDTGSIVVSLTTGAAASSRGPASKPHRPARRPDRRPIAARHQVVTGPLSVRPASTATLAGTVLTNGNQPLAGVTLSIGHHKATSDALGWFTLRGLVPGRHLLQIDGTTAAPADDWGYFSEVVDLVANFPNQVATPIWMTKIDNAHAVNLPTKITKPIVVTTPRIPGLALHIAAGTVIRDRNGAVVRKISITPVPVDRSPIPLPVDAPIPMYFTIQPGGATISGKGVQLSYPNWGDQRPGTRMTFWSYGERWDGWWVYGHGTVTPDGKEVIPDKGTYLHNFQGAMFNSGPKPPPNGPGCFCGAGDPVDLTTGLFNFSQTDLTEPDVLPLSLTRSYRQGDPSVYRFGIGTNDLYGMNLWSTSMASGQGWLNVALVLPNGQQIPFTRATPQTTWVSAEFAETDKPGPFYGAILDWNGLGWDLTLTNGLTYTFGEIAPLQSITDRYGDAIEITHSNGDGATGPITNVTSPNGRWMRFSYSSLNCIACVSAVTDNSGRTASYTYDSSERLVAVADVRGHTESYAYDSSNEMTTVTDPLGHSIVTNSYNPDGTVATQSTPGGGTVSFSYVKNQAGHVTKATFKDQRGAVQTMTFNSFQEPVTDVRATGTSLQRTTTYQYNPVSGLVTKMTDPLGRKTTYAYDHFGNLTAETQLAGTPSARTIRQSFDPAFSRLTSVTDPAGETTRLVYRDTPGTSTQMVTDPDSHTTEIEIKDGNVVSVTDGDGDRLITSYDGADLTAVTDADGRTSRQFEDSAGFTVATTSPDGATTRYAYDAAGNLISTTDPLGGVTTATYDAADDELAFTDASHHTTRYGYNALYRLITQTDPLGAKVRFGYDTASDLTSYTDGNGTVDKASYNILGELTSVRWGTAGSRVKDRTSYTYDAAGRLLSESDANDGSIANSYNGLDELIAQTQPAGKVTYTYDANGRPASISAGKAPKVSYAYDAASYPISISTGSGKAALSYDAAGRLVKEADPGVTQVYAYDPAGNITAIATTSARPLIIRYTFNADGMQATQTANASLLLTPTVISSAVYNADNELTALNGHALSYDHNGALLRDRTTRYTWNAQQQLTAISDGSRTTRISNDPFGRQAAVTTAAGTTRYLFNGSDLALAAAPAGSTSYATDPRTQSAVLEAGPRGTMSLTTDRLGSPTAIIGRSGKKLASYAYDPFGNSSITGASTSVLGYAGYQQAVSGLDATATRYYNPALSRFISQDPLGTTAGQNPYAYVLDDPVNLSDPSGLDPHATHKGIDLFLFGSHSKTIAGTPRLGPVALKLEREGIGLVNLNTASGLSVGGIGALGLALDVAGNVGSYFLGVEKMSGQAATWIQIAEGALGAKIPALGGAGIGSGAFCTGTGENGVFLFAHGEIAGQDFSVGGGIGW